MVSVWIVHNGRLPLPLASPFAMGTMTRPTGDGRAREEAGGMCSITYYVDTVTARKSPIWHTQHTRGVVDERRNSIMTDGTDTLKTVDF